MNSIFDPSFDSTPSHESDIRHTFTRAWRELGVREEAEMDLRGDCDSLWLECIGELVDAGSVTIVADRTCGRMVGIVEFMCPRCGQCHESLRFR